MTESSGGSGGSGNQMKFKVCLYILENGKHAGAICLSDSVSERSVPQRRRRDLRFC